jgi:hypothetical protein
VLALGAPLTATRTVSVELACAPVRGVRIDRCGVGAVGGAAALVAWVLTGATVVAAVLLLLAPQPLAATTSARLTHSGPVLWAALMMRFLPVGGSAGDLDAPLDPNWFVSISDSRLALILSCPGGEGFCRDGVLALDTAQRSRPEST